MGGEKWGQGQGNSLLTWPDGDVECQENVGKGESLILTVKGSLVGKKDQLETQKGTQLGSEQGRRPQVVTDSDFRTRPDRS